MGPAALAARLGGQTVDHEAVLTAARLDSRSLERILTVADRGKLLIPVARSLFRASVPLPEGWDGRVATRLLRRRRLASLMFELAPLVGATGATFVKGFGLEALYGVDYRRQFADLDLVLQTGHQFWDVCEILVAAGFRPAVVTLARRQQDGEVVALASLRRNGQNIDVTAGALPLRWRSSYGLGDAWRHQVVGTGDRAVAVPMPASAFLVHAAELLENRRVAIRDALDMSILARSVPAEEREVVIATIADAGLETQLVRATVALTRLGLKAPPPLPTTGICWPGRGTLQFDRRAGGAARALSGLARDAGVALGHRRSGRVAITALSEWVPGRRAFERGAYVQFMPLRSDVRGGFRWLDSSVLLTPLVCLLAAPLGVVGRQCVRANHRVSAPPVAPIP